MRELCKVWLLVMNKSIFHELSVYFLRSNWWHIFPVLYRGNVNVRTSLHFTLLWLTHVWGLGSVAKGHVCVWMCMHNTDLLTRSSIILPNSSFVSIFFVGIETFWGTCYSWILRFIPCIVLEFSTRFLSVFPRRRSAASSPSEAASRRSVFSSRSFHL